MDDQPQSLPFEPYAQALREQRNNALDAVAELTALVSHLKAENERLVEENDKLRSETSGNTFRA
jgi:regulator of replication initiation timing